MILTSIDPTPVVTDPAPAPADPPTPVSPPAVDPAPANPVPVLPANPAPAPSADPAPPAANRPAPPPAVVAPPANPAVPGPSQPDGSARRDRCCGCARAAELPGGTGRRPRRWPARPLPSPLRSSPAQRPRRRLPRLWLPPRRRRALSRHSRRPPLSSPRVPFRQQPPRQAAHWAFKHWLCSSCWQPALFTSGSWVEKAPAPSARPGSKHNASSSWCWQRLQGFHRARGPHYPPDSLLLARVQPAATPLECHDQGVFQIGLER